MTLSNERLNKAITMNSPKSLRRLLSDFIRISGIIENHRNSLLDIKQRIRKAISDSDHYPSLNLITPKKSDSRRRSRSEYAGVYVCKKNPISFSVNCGKPFKISYKRQRSHSSKAAMA